MGFLRDDTNYRLAELLPHLVLVDVHNQISSTPAYLLSVRFFSPCKPSNPPRKTCKFVHTCRSPLLSCTFGVFIVLRYVATTYEYIFIWRGDDIGKHGVLDLIGFPALMTAEIAVIMTAVRLLVMYYPSKRARWGRYVKETFLIRALGGLWVLIEIAVWSSAWALGVSR